MARKPFVGSGRQQEGGFSATHKQDFNSHVQGGGFRHGATDIDMEPPVGGLKNQFLANTVQETIEKLVAVFSDTVRPFVSIGDGYNIGDVNVGEPGIPTLKDAFDCAFMNSRIQDGGIILVKAATYRTSDTIEVPAGITIMGEPTGTVIIGEMSEDPIFLFLEATDNQVIGPSSLETSRQKSQSKLWLMTLFDNLDGYAAAGAPSMSTVPMVQCQRGSNVVIEQCSIVGRAVDTPSVSVTKRGIGYASNTTTEATSLEVLGCFFDSVRTAIDFDPIDGRTDVLKVQNCRARTFGDGGLADQTDRFFCTFAPCMANLSNNFHIGLNDTWQAEGCFLIKDVAVGDSDVYITLTGNNGDLDGSFVDALTQTNFLVDQRATKTALQIIQSGNSWGQTYNNNFYYTVGDGTNSIGDINGTDAVDLVIKKLSDGVPGVGSGVTAYIQTGTYVVSENGALGDGVRLVGLETDTGTLPTLQLSLGAGQFDSLGRRTLVVGGLLENIFFENLGSASTFQSVSSRFQQLFVVKNCTFRNCGLQSFGILNALIENCTFNQDVNANVPIYTDNISLDLEPSGPAFDGKAREIVVSKCNFFNRGYAINISGGSGASGDKIVLESNFFNPFQAITVAPTVTTASPRPLSYYINVSTSFDDVVFSNNVVKGFLSTASLESMPSAGLAVSGSFDRMISFALMNNVILEKNRIFGTNNFFLDGVTQFPTPVVFAAPNHSLNANDNLIVGPLPLQVGGSFSGASGDAPERNNGYISIEGNELKGYPENAQNICNTVLDLDLPAIAIANNSENIAQCDVINNNFGTGQYTTFRQPRHINNTGGNYANFASVQAYGQAWRFNISDNVILGVFPAGYALSNAHLLRVDSEVSQSIAADFRQRAAAVVSNNNFIADANFSPSAGQNLQLLSVRSAKSRTEGNDFRFMSLISAAVGSQLGFLENESSVKGNTIVNNTFQNGAVVVFGSNGFITLTGSGGGIIGHNAFSTARTNNVTNAVDNAITDNTSGQDWHVATNNVGIRYRYPIRYTVGKVLVEDDNYYDTSITDLTVSYGQNNSDALNLQVGLSATVNVKYKVDLKDIFPLNAKIAVAELAFGGDFANFTGGTVTLSLIRFDAVADVVVVSDTETIPPVSTTLTIGTQSSPIDEVINDKFIQVQFQATNNSGFPPEPVLNLGVLNIWIEV